jgi:hypothetical protein
LHEDDSPTPGNSRRDNAGMRLLFNGTQIGDNFAVKLAPSRQLLRNKAMIGYGFAWQVEAEGYITLDGAPATTNVRMQAIETALRAVGDLKFLHDDGSSTLHAWTSSSTFTGIRCTSLTWDDRPGAQFKTFRGFNCKFEWEEHFTGQGAFLLDFTEEIEIDSPLPTYIVNEAVNGFDPEAIITVLKPKWSARQSGTAIGLAGYPDLLVVAPKVFGSTTPPLKKETIRRKSPERAGANYRGYTVSWTYEYESAVLLDDDAVPNRWN